MPRFFVTPDVLGDKFITLTGANAEHARVLRLAVGEKVTLCDGNGTDYLCTVSDLSRDRCSLVLQDASPSASEAKLRVTLYVALPKSDKMEHIVQKATELGAAEIVAFASTRCVSRPDNISLGKKCDRWQKIAAAAAEQSGRGMIPTVRTAEYAKVLKEAADADLGVLFYENERGFSLRDAIGNHALHTAALITGPEGGFSPEEISEAQAAGLNICTLGPRILRCETAPLCALAALMYAAGELG